MNSDNRVKLESGRELVLIMGLFGALFLASVDNQLLIPLLPRLSRQFSTPVESLSWVFSVYALSGAIFNLFLGPLTDRFGRVVFLRTGLVLFAIVALFTARAESFGELLAARTGAGMTGGLISTAAVSFIGDHFPYGRRGRVMGIVLSSYFVALILGVPFSSWIAEQWSWRWSFCLSASLAVVFFILFMVGVKRDSGGGYSKQPRVWGSYRSLIQSRELVAALAGSFVISGGTFAFMTLIAGYLNDSFGLDAFQISLVFLVSGLAAVAASPVSGWLSDRWTKRKVFLLANTVMAVLLLLLDRVGYGALMFLTLFFIGLSISFRQTALQTLQTELVSIERRGSFLSLRNCFSQLGISASVFVAGFLYADFGYRSVLWLSALLTVAGSAIVFRMIREPADLGVGPRES